MAKTITPIDASAILNLVAKQALGEATVAKLDLTNYVSVGERIMSTGYENVLGSLSLVAGQLLVGVKPIRARLALIQSEEDAGTFTSQFRKIIFYRKGAKEAGFQNTDKHSRNLYDGYDNGVNGSSTTSSVGNMWEQDLPITTEIWFGGSEVWDFCLTTNREQLQQAFRSPEDFAKFWNGVVVQKNNEIEIAKEAYNRKTLLNYIGGLYTLGTTPFTQGGTDYKMPGSAVNLTAAYNTKFGLTGANAKTTAALLSSDLKSFLGFLVAEIKKYSDYMSEMSNEYQLPLTKKDNAGNVCYYETQSNKEDQRLMLLSSLLIDAEAQVYPEIFNDKYLKIENYEPVSFWQSRSTRDKVMVKANIPTVTVSSNVVSISSTQTVQDSITIDHVIGLLFDKKACRTQYQFESTDSTGLEARKRYSNTWFHAQKNSINDFSEKGILFYMADPVVEEQQGNS